MVKLNHHYTKLRGSYLFQEIARKTAALREKNPGVTLINFGIGDITRPISPTIALALENASREMGMLDTFKGYAPSQGYSFLRDAIAEHDYRNLPISADEIFISDGAKNDIANVQELFALENKIAVPNPTYPVYIDTNVMAGRTGISLKKGGYEGVVYLPCNEANGFTPDLPDQHCDIIYLCSPNNPTGMAMTRESLRKWVNYARENQAIILFDGAYEAYIRSPDCPSSIYEIEGAEEVAVEFRSFSKTAGFTGLRCSYTVVPHALKITEENQTHSLHARWKRRHETKSNGVSYPTQCAAAAVYSKTGLQEVRLQIDAYLQGATNLKNSLTTLGFKVVGGHDAPYLWLKTPEKLTSWEFFDILLEKTQIITTPGVGFGSEGEGYLRLSAFGHPNQLEEGARRLTQL
jgi:LL-diaminopimelate aminotransferase